MSIASRLAFVLGAVTVFAAAAAAWGPRAQTSIVTTAAHVLTKDGIPLSPVRDEIRDGSMVSREMMDARYPEYASNPLRAVEAETALMQRVYSGKIDPYFAYRLGALGKLVAEITSPLEGVPDTYRNLYFADAENAIDTANVEIAPRRTLPIIEYLQEQVALANANNIMIQQEYAEGVGFTGAASGLLPQDVSRSVNSVADVWYAVFNGAANPSQVSETRLTNYVLGAFEFYVARRNQAELDAAESRYADLVTFTPDLRLQIGDMYLAAGLREKALEHFQAAKADAPDRRDIAERIAAYFAATAEEAEQEGNLEEAQEKYAEAAAADPLHPTAEQRRLEMEELITEREARRAADEAALQQGEEFILLAEQEATRNHFAEAISLLRQARANYDTISSEFPDIEGQAGRGLQDIEGRIAQLKSALVENALTYSGTAVAADARELAQSEVGDLDTQALQKLLQRGYEAQVRALQDEMTDELTPR